MTKIDVTTIILGDKTKELLDKYAKDHSISRSAAIRMMCNDFFLRQKIRISNEPSKDFVAELSELD